VSAPNIRGLAASPALLSESADNLNRLYNITRWRLGRITGVLLKPSDFFFKKFYVLSQLFIFFGQLFDNSVFVLHTPF